MRIAIFPPFISSKSQKFTIKLWNIELSQRNIKVGECITFKYTVQVKIKAQKLQNLQEPMVYLLKFSHTYACKSIDAAEITIQDLWNTGRIVLAHSRLIHEI